MGNRDEQKVFNIHAERPFSSAVFFFNTPFLTKAIVEKDAHLYLSEVGDVAPETIEIR